MLMIYRFVQTRFGLPKPWTPEEVQAHLAQVRKELNNSGMHAYFIVKRIWVGFTFHSLC